MALDRARLLDAFDRIGAAAIAHGSRLDLAVYGGSALLLASNFRFATEDVDVADVSRDTPSWLQPVIDALAAENEWAVDWLNDAVSVHLSPLASNTADHAELGSFPRGAGPYGLVISVPSAKYLLALKLKAMRVLDPARGEHEASDV